MKACERCGKEFVAQRPTAKFCGNVCRSAASKARARDAKKQTGAKVLQIRPPEQTLSSVAVNELGMELSIELYARQELGAAINSTIGQMCLTAARRIDRGDVVGSALATTLGRLDLMLEKVASANAVSEVKADETNPITFLQQRAVERQRRGA